MTPHRDRAPQEVTPVHLDSAARPASAAARPAPAPIAAASVPPDPVLTREEIERDVAVVRRRAIATAAYGAGSVAVASAVGLGGGPMWSGLAVPALSLTLFCGLAAVGGTLWTWLGARRLGDAGISVFDALDGAWRETADRAAPTSAGRAVGRASRQPAGEAQAGRARRLPDAHRVPATPEVLASRWGSAVTRAVEDRAGVAHLVADLGPADRDMIPDVLPTADMLVRRVGELATTLHELDRDAPPHFVADVEARIAAARQAAADPPDTDQARRLELLGRQLETLTDLAQRRQQLAARIESAGLMLQNMRLDLLRLRSAGIESALGELSSVTREAGALSRDIGRALDVAAELRRD